MNSTNSMKKIFSYVFIIGLSIVFILAFSLTGGSLSGGNSQLIGRVNDKPIRYGRRSRYSFLVQNIVENWREQGIDVTKELERYAFQEAFKRMAEQIIIKDYANNNRIYIGDKDLLTYIRSQFIDSETGDFLSVEYENFARNADILEKQYREESAHTDLKIKFTFHTLFSYVPVSRQAVLDRITIGEFQRKAWIALTTLEDKFENYADDATLKEYYQENASNFSSPFEQIKEIVRAEYVNNNSHVLRTRAHADYSVKLAQAEDEFKKDFSATAQKLGLTTVSTDWINYYSENLIDLDGEPIVNLSTPDIIQQIMALDEKDKVTVVHSESAIAAIKITDTRSSQSKEEQLSDFVLKRHEDEIQNTQKDLLVSSFSR